MSYEVPLETEGTAPRSVGSAESIRKLTESQGARSLTYEVAETTGKVVRAGTKPAVRVPLKDQLVDSRSVIAQREHIARILRDCEAKSEALVACTDPVECGLVGAVLISNLQELWRHRAAREPDWGEIVNILQILLAGQEFESLSQEKRFTLRDIFQKGLLRRTLGRPDVERILALLSRARFDLFRGISEAAAPEEQQGA